jgi:hypothetical protein
MTVPARFGILRLIATLFKVLAWIVLVFSILGALIFGVVGSMARQAATGLTFLPEALILDETSGVILGLLMIIMGVIGFLTLLASAEGIQLQLAIEENTRLTAALLLRLEAQNAEVEEPPYAYYGEVVEQQRQ